MPRHLNEVLFEGELLMPIIPVCEHFAGTEQRITGQSREPRAEAQSWRSDTDSLAAPCYCAETTPAMANMGQ